MSIGIDEVDAPFFSVGAGVDIGYNKDYDVLSFYGNFPVTAIVEEYMGFGDGPNDTPALIALRNPETYELMGLSVMGFLKKRDKWAAFVSCTPDPGISFRALLSELRELSEILQEL